jgi:hypothetical protein
MSSSDLALTHHANSVQKQTLPQYIQKWVIVDNQLKILQDKIKPLRELKCKLTSEIHNILQETNSTHKIIEIPNEELKLIDKKEYSSLTFGYIEECMHQLIPDPEQVVFVMNYLKEHRETKHVPDIRRCARKDTRSNINENK